MNFFAARARTYACIPFLSLFVASGISVGQTTPPLSTTYKLIAAPLADGDGYSNLTSLAVTTFTLASD
jgi:hypothetical protein